MLPVFIGLLGDGSVILSYPLRTFKEPLVQNANYSRYPALMDTNAGLSNHHFLY